MNNQLCRGTDFAQHVWINGNIAPENNVQLMLRKCFPQNFFRFAMLLDIARIKEVSDAKFTQLQGIVARQIAIKIKRYIDVNTGTITNTFRVKTTAVRNHTQGLMGMLQQLVGLLTVLVGDKTNTTTGVIQLSVK